MNMITFFALVIPFVVASYASDKNDPARPKKYMVPDTNDEIILIKKSSGTDDAGVTDAKTAARLIRVIARSSDTCASIQTQSQPKKNNPDK